MMRLRGAHLASATRLLPVLLAPALLLQVGCPGLDPSALYRNAAQQLRFNLDSVDPRLELALPLDRSRLVLRLGLGVDNPSKVHFRLKGLSGRVILDEGGASHPIGTVDFPQGLDLPAGKRGQTTLDLGLGYKDLRDAWTPLNAVVRNRRQATWRLEGEATLEAYGLTFKLPIRASKGTGGS